MNWYLEALRKYFVFSGRAKRKEYWYFVLFYIVGFVLAAILDGAIGYYNYDESIGIISGLFLLFHIVPGLSVAVRRLHDIGKSGWWVLISFFPIIGPFVLFIFTLLDSKEDEQIENNSKGEGDEDETIR